MQEAAKTVPKAKSFLARLSCPPESRISASQDTISGRPTLIRLDHTKQVKRWRLVIGPEGEEPPLISEPIIRPSIPNVAATSPLAATGPLLGYLDSYYCTETGLGQLSFICTQQ